MNSFDDENPDSKWQSFAEVLPLNERTAQIMKKREEKEELIRVKQLEMKVAKEQEEKKKRKREQSEAAEKQRKEKAARDNEARQRELEQEASLLQGKIQLILADLYNNKTAFDITLSGVKLGKTRCEILARQVAYNDSLMSLHL